jgi:hypothetical protein
LMRFLSALFGLHHGGLAAKRPPWWRLEGISGLIGGRADQVKADGAATAGFSVDGL